MVCMIDYSRCADGEISAEVYPETFSKEILVEVYPERSRRAGMTNKVSFNQKEPLR